MPDRSQTGWLTKLQQKFHNQIKRWSKTFSLCRKHFSEPAVHEVRVQSRRLLSLLSIISLTGQDISSATKKIKTTLSRFSRLRDVHVQQLLLKDFVENPPKHLLAVLARNQKRLSKKLKRDLQALTDDQLIRQLRKIDRGLIKQSRSTVAAELTLQAIVMHIEQSFTEMVENAQADGGSDIAHIHEVRILFKKYRYSVEAISGIIPVQSKMSAVSMHHFQALMGEIHDLENLKAHLDKYLKKHPDRQQEVQIIQTKISRKQGRQIKEYQKWVASTLCRNLA